MTMTENLNRTSTETISGGDVTVGVSEASLDRALQLNEIALKVLTYRTELTMFYTNLAEYEGAAKEELVGISRDCQLNQLDILYTTIMMGSKQLNDIVTALIEHDERLKEKFELGILSQNLTALESMSAVEGESEERPRTSPGGNAIQ